MWLIEVNKARPKITKTEPLLTSGSINAFQVEFKFDSDWDDLNKFAVFRMPDGTVYEIFMDTSTIVNIPWEILQTAGAVIQVGAYGVSYDGRSMRLPTIWIKLMEVSQGVTEGLEPSEPSPDVYSQFLNSMNNKADSIEYTNNVLSLMSGSKVLAQVKVVSSNEPGYSPIVNIDPIDGGYHLSIQDKDGIHTADIMNGQDGEDGQNGVSPIVVVSEATDGHKIEITDINGTQEFIVLDGDISLVDRTFLMINLHSSSSMPPKGEEFYLPFNAFIGHNPTVGNNQEGMVVFEGKLYYLMFDVRAVENDTAILYYDTDPELLGGASADVDTRDTWIKEVKVYPPNNPSNVSEMFDTKVTCTIEVEQFDENAIIGKPPEVGNQFYSIFTFNNTENNHDTYVGLFEFVDTPIYSDGLGYWSGFEAILKYAYDLGTDSGISSDDVGSTLKLDSEGKLNVATPVQSIVTKEEFDALTDDAKNTGFYVISDGGSGGGGGSSSGGADIPSGLICMWSGETPPDGWYLCDGENGTPDLRGRFILGTGTTYALGTTGGEITHRLTVSEMPQHSHQLALSNIGTSISSSVCAYPGTATAQTTMNVYNVGNNQPHNNMPPYYVLAFIMKA